MNPIEQGGCTLAMYTGAVMFPSKTDHIMSRYRPIAPKPVAPKPEGTDQNDSASSSSLSVEKSTTKSTEYKGRRARKRTSDANSTRTLKRTRNGSSGRAATGKAGTPKRLEYQKTSFNLTPIFSDRVAPVFGPGGLQRFNDSFEQSHNSGVSVSLSLAPKLVNVSVQSVNLRLEDPNQMGLLNLNSPMLCPDDGVGFSAGSAKGEVLEKDRGFMELAAANAPVLFPAERSTIPGLKKNLSFACPSVSHSYGGESEVCSGEDFAESRKSNLVTLSLLPDTPSHMDIHSLSSTPARSVLGSELKYPAHKPAPARSNLNTNLTMYSKGRWPEEENMRECKLESFRPVAARGFVERVSNTSQGYCGGSLKSRVVDWNYLEQHHGTSAEPIMLTDELNRVLWVNPAFKRFSSERMSNRLQSIGPHIDPLGIPTQLNVVTFQPPFRAPKCKAILWGFLKKFILHEAGTYVHFNSPGGQTKVIAPLPVRAVGSTIHLESISSSDPHAVSVVETLESAQERLERGDMPSAITDIRHRVWWVNTAYKRMVGQPECLWLASTMGCNNDEDPRSQARLAGEVSLVCDSVQPPAETAAFLCGVQIQWSNQGEHSTMSVPAEVVRLYDATSGCMHLWSFDISNVGVKDVVQIKDNIFY